ncbi:hypothetical protein [Streptomyces syringium]|uniref:hypothetical protein n=1 Tax=Streptomyces syringium TaxID=76729 RepID=UPI0037D34868
MHGNELRKGGRRGAAVTRLTHPAALAPDRAVRNAALPVPARAVGRLGNGHLFDTVVEECGQLLDTGVEHTRCREGPGRVLP